MPLHDVIRVDDETSDSLIRVEFAPGQDDKTLLDALHALVNTLRRGRAGNRFEEVVEVEMTTTGCQVRLRYFSDTKRQRLGLGESGYADVLINWYHKYLFATVDHVRKIQAHPFHVPDLAIYLEEPEPFDKDPDP